MYKLSILREDEIVKSEQTKYLFTLYFLCFSLSLSAQLHVTEGSTFTVKGNIQIFELKGNNSIIHIEGQTLVHNLSMIYTTMDKNQFPDQKMAISTSDKNAKKNTTSNAKTQLKKEESKQFALMTVSSNQPKTNLFLFKGKLKFATTNHCQPKPLGVSGQRINCPVPDNFYSLPNVELLNKLL